MTKIATHANNARQTVLEEKQDPDCFLPRAPSDLISVL